MFDVFIVALTMEFKEQQIWDEADTNTSNPLTVLRGWFLHN